MILCFKSLAFFGMVLAVALALFLPGFLSMFWGDKFEKANHLIFWLMVGACLTPLSLIMYHMLISIGKEKLLLIENLLPVVIQLAANFYLIPRYGSFGAVLGMVVFFLSTFIIIAILSVKNNIYKLVELTRTFIAIIIVVAILLCYMVLFSQTYLSNNIFIMLITVIGSIVLIDKSEWKLVLRELTAKKVL